ncbi:MAG: (2Fe-2S) ferredoxin domain-containing protein [Bacteriovoracaceae bacterium]|jgi:predicted metal-binding protein|nr:hypothetical protein [Halobacteriovoraceae bacterium]MDP7320260.1 (2Fe-2S) ferredoxin domain-containing protein [Bacteriovoracaceae bacterium]
MKIEKRKTKRHLFICCNLKPETKPSCGAKDAQSLVQAIKSKLKKNDLWGEYKVSKSGCLGPCSYGVSALLFPENELITELTLSDEEALYQRLTGEL